MAAFPSARHHVQRRIACTVCAGGNKHSTWSAALEAARKRRKSHMESHEEAAVQEEPASAEALLTATAVQY